MLKGGLTLKQESQLKNYIHSLNTNIFGVKSIDSVSLKNITTGYHNINYILYINKEPSKKFIFRFNPHPGKFDTTDKEYEKLLHLNGFYAPKALHLGTPEFIDSPILIMEFVEGKHKDFRKLTQEEVKLLARAIADIHKKTSRKFSVASGAPADKVGTYKDYLESMIAHGITPKLKRANPKIYAADKEMVDMARQLLADVMDKNKLIFSGSIFSLIHHDINPPNTLWHNRNITFVDWSGLAYGDRAEEIGYMFAINDSSKEFQKTFLDEYMRLISDPSLPDRIKVCFLKNRIFDVAWAISMRDEQSRGNNKLTDRQLRDLYTPRLNALKKTLSVTAPLWFSA